MAEVMYTIIYYHPHRDDDRYIVSLANASKIDIPELSVDKYSYTEEEKAYIRKFVESDPELEMYLDTFDIWVNITYDELSTGLSGKKLSYVINRINSQDSSSLAISYSYFIFDHSKKSWKKIRNEYDKKSVELEIAHEELKIISQSVDKLSKEQIEKIIDDFRVKSAKSYAVMLCEKCEKYVSFIVKNKSMGECSICHHLQEIINPIYTGISVYDANKKAIEANAGKVNEKQEEITETVVFHYLGKPYLPFSDQEKQLHDRIYLQRDGKAIFKNVDGKIIFKDNYVKFVEAYNKNFINNAKFELEQLQIDLRKDYFDEDVALYWYFNTYPLGTSYLKDRYSIFVKGEVFHSVDKFINAFLLASSDKQKFYMTLLNDVYLKYFFIDENHEPLFPYNGDDKYVVLSKLIYLKTKNYVYFDIYHDKIYQFGKNFIEDLRRDDDLNKIRYEFLNMIMSEANSFHLPEGIYYSAVMEDSYDYNCYIYSYIKHNGYYYFRNLRLPIDRDSIHVINRMIEDKYFNTYGNRRIDDDFNDLLFLYKNKILNADLTMQIYASLEEAFRGLHIETLDNLTEIYIRSVSNIPHTQVRFLYKGKGDTLLGHLENAFKNNELVSFIKEREIETITNLIYKDEKNKIFANAEKTFTSMNNRIKELLTH